MRPIQRNTGAPAREAPIRVLFLDDQRFDRHRLARLCSGMDMEFEVSNADSLAALGPLLESQVFDLVFVDYGLPDGSGLDALDMIRLNPRNCNAATIMVTGSGQDDLAIAALKGGCSDYITKDLLTQPALTRAVTNALQKSSLSAEVQAQTLRSSEMEAVLKRFATECAREVKPMLSRMMRQMRDLRSAPFATAEQLQNQYDMAEESCMHLWEFLVELERYQTSALISKAIADLPAAPPAARKKPPSPFSSFTQ